MSAFGFLRPCGPHIPVGTRSPTTHSVEAGGPRAGGVADIWVAEALWDAYYLPYPPPLPKYKKLKQIVGG